MLNRACINAISARTMYTQSKGVHVDDCPTQKVRFPQNVRPLDEHANKYQNNMKSVEIRDRGVASSGLVGDSVLCP